MTLVLRGKVREVHSAGEGRLAMIASDRISAYDVVLPTAIPDKGRVLTGLSLHWFARTADIVPNHLLPPADLPPEFRTPDLAGRTMLVRRLTMLPVECVARGYLAGSGYRDYRDTGAICGHRLPPGLRLGDPLPEPIFTPATKAEEGHDENLTLAEAAGPGRAPRRWPSSSGSRSRSTRGPPRTAGPPGSSWPTPSSSSAGTPRGAWCWATRW